MAPAAVAQGALPESVRGCAAIDDDGKRLACYDAAVSLADAQVAKATEARKIAAAERAKVLAEKVEADRLVALAADEKAKVDNFGVGSVDVQDRPASAIAAAKSELENLEATVTSVFYTPTKKLLLALDNGQIWRQTDSSSSPLMRVGDKVEIKKGILGGFRMKLLRQKRMLEVLRFR